MKRTWLPTIAYALALLPLVIGSHAAATAAFAIYDRLPVSIQKSDWIGVFLNDIAPAVSGVLCALVLAKWLARHQAFAATVSGFAVRTAPWLFLASAIGYVVWREKTNSDFGLWSQIITWPLAALVAGLTTDAAVTWWRASARPAV
jgi:hypothetical protein